jgi:transcription antitermination factor NusA-like protein
MAIRSNFVPLVIGKKGENIREVSKQTGCEIMFSDRPHIEARTPDRSDAKLCKFQGTPTSISNSVKLILDKLGKLTD